MKIYSRGWCFVLAFMVLLVLTGCQNTEEDLQSQKQKSTNKKNISKTLKEEKKSADRLYDEGLEPKAEKISKLDSANLDFLSEDDIQENGEKIIWNVSCVKNDPRAKIVLDKSKYNEVGNACYELLVENGDGKVIWKDSIGKPHSAWGGYSVCCMDGINYLLYYSPELYQQTGIYQYKLFRLSQKGKEVVKKKGVVEFSYKDEEGIEDIDQMVQFANNINKLHKKSVLLCACFVNENLYYSTINDLYRVDDAYSSWLNTKEMREALLDYNKKLKEYYLNN